MHKTSVKVRASAIALVATASLLAPTAVWAGSQQERAVPATRLSKIQFDPPGDDVSTNRQLNKEWVQVHNFGTKPRDLSGWLLRDITGFKFRFPTGFVLAPGATVTIHTGKGTNTAVNLFWGQGAYIWNNGGDKATLKNAAGVVVDTCKYSGSGPSVIC